jgi:hypothetical protein
MQVMEDEWSTPIF